VAQFFDVFRQYHEAVWPAPLLLLAGAVASVGLALHGGPWAARTLSAILAVLWLWMGAVYHIGFFSAINPAAAIFGALFIGQGALFIWLGVRSTRLAFTVRRDTSGIAGALLIGYALVVYPVLGHLLGHRYPASPTFGLPCPTTIFTLGILLWSRAPVPRVLVVVPMLWAALGAVAAMQLGVPEDFGLLAAGLVAGPMILLAPRRRDLVHVA
jgi:hypothetical protein